MQKILKQFLALESGSGILLLLMATLGMVWANSPLGVIYQQFTRTFQLFINEGLMAIFFLVVGLELKRNFFSGPLSHFAKILLPTAAAVGGMLVPVLIYYVINANNDNTLKGWATPVATDIAFALGVLSLLGRRIPVQLKVFLLALAIIDDIGAIIIIALFFTQSLSYLMLFQAALLLVVLYLLNRYPVRSLLPYLFIGVLLWVCLYHSGVHPTIAGVLLAFAIPVEDHQGQSPSSQLESFLHPWVAYFIIPLFALSNAGFSFAGMSFSTLFNGLVLGIALGLFIGKQVGVFGFTWLFVKSGLAKLPEGATWLSIYGVALLGGIGFTMSLFLGTLSFQQEAAVYLSEMRLGVIIGSVLSGLVGAMVLIIATEERSH